MIEPTLLLPSASADPPLAVPSQPSAATTAMTVADAIEIAQTCAARAHRPDRGLPRSQRLARGAQPTAFAAQAGQSRNRPAASRPMPRPAASNPLIDAARRSRRSPPPESSEMSVFAEPLNLGDLLKYEAPNLYSRDRVTVASGQNLPLGTVVGIVTATGKVQQIDPSAEDGTQVAAGVLLQALRCHLIDRDDGLVVARHAIVAHHARLARRHHNAEKLAAIAQLKALGVLVRQRA